MSGFSASAIFLVALVSLGGLLFTWLEGFPLWIMGTAVLLPWLPAFVRDLAWTAQRYGWVALFYAVVVTQLGHCVEHVSQMIEIHVLGMSGPAASGIFGALDIESVHFAWNTWVILAVGLLLIQNPYNPWLWLTTLLAGWHEIEHAYIFSVYLQTGLSGTPGLLSKGGAIRGGLPLSRPDLHFWYNIVETAPLVVGFFSQIRQGARSARRASPRLSRV